MRRSTSVPSLEAVGVITGQAEPSIRTPDLEPEAHILRLYSSVDVGRECGAGTRLSDNADVIGGFTHALHAGLSQLDDGPPNLTPSINLDDRPQDRLHQIQRMPPSDGEQVGAGRSLIKISCATGIFWPESRAW
jgi:hypothetical protein